MEHYPCAVFYGCWSTNILRMLRS